MSVETKQRMLGFAFFFSFFSYVLGYFCCCCCSLLFLLQATFCAPGSTAAAGVSDVTGGAAFGTSSCQQPCVSRKGHSRAPPALHTRGCFPAVLPGEGDGVFWGATLRGGVAVGGQAAGDGVSQELSGTGARPLGCFGVLARAEVGL